MLLQRNKGSAYEKRDFFMEQKMYEFSPLVSDAVRHHSWLLFKKTPKKFLPESKNRALQEAVIPTKRAE